MGRRPPALEPSEGNLDRYMAKTLTRMRNAGRPAQAEEENHRVRVGRERSARTRRQLLDSVLYMCSNETSRAPTMIDDIVKHAGVSRGTFYTHFDTVEEAVAEAGSMLADEMVDDAKLVFDGLESAMARTATGILLFLTRALFDEQWGGFIVRVGLLREENLLSQDIRADIGRGVEAGQYSVRNAVAASDMIFGTVVEAILRVNQGHRSTRYIRDITEMLLNALGVDMNKASQAVQESFERLTEIAPQRLGWWKSLDGVG
jgi:AcrR family transcriptional regulator